MVGDPTSHTYSRSPQGQAAAGSSSAPTSHRQNQALGTDAPGLAEARRCGIPHPILIVEPLVGHRSRRSCDRADTGQCRLRCGVRAPPARARGCRAASRLTRHASRVTRRAPSISGHHASITATTLPAQIIGRSADD